MKFEKIINIIYYNFNLLYYKFKKLLIVYLNPFSWLNNLSKIKLGRKQFFEHLEMNFEHFDYFYKYDRITKYNFYGYLLVLIIATLLYVSAIINIKLNFYVICIIAILLNEICFSRLITRQKKFIDYHKKFTMDKKYNYPMSFFILSIIYILLSIFLYTSIK